MFSKKELTRYLRLLEYELALVEAEESLIRFAEVTFPISRHMDDPSRTGYSAYPHHRFMASLMERVERGEHLKVINSTAPRHGKSHLCTIDFAAWYHGRHPERDIIIATYGEQFARDFGIKVREKLESVRFRQIFPDYSLKKVAADHMMNVHGGNIYCLGRRSPTTGRGGDLIIVDDPTKDDKEASSTEFREDLWQWFTQTLLSRRHTDKAAVTLSQTRWSEDDIVGRLTDEANPAFSQKLRDGFEIFALPAIAGIDDPMGREPGEPLWPERFGLQYLEEMREANPKAFSALYMANPVPDRGLFYQADGIYEYAPSDTPKNLTMYVASDFAVSTKNINDRTCLVPYGVCENGIAWVMPDVVWDRMQSDAAVEAMVKIVRDHKPVFWYAEKGQLSRAIGPFFTSRLKEEGLYVPVIMHPAMTDKKQFAHSARALCAQGRIMFPRWAPWWTAAKTEMLRFDSARFDDFVDTVSIIGFRMNEYHGPGQNLVKSKPVEGTFAALKAQFRRQDDDARARSGRAGW